MHQLWRKALLLSALALTATISVPTCLHGQQLSATRGGLGGVITDKSGAIIPDAMIERMESASDPAAEGRRICIDFVRELGDIPNVAGVHIMAPGNDAVVPDIIIAARAIISRLTPV